MVLKNILLLFAAFPFLYYSKSDELSLSYSPMSVYRLGHTVEEGATESNHSVLGAITFEYYHSLNKRVSIGISAMFDRESAKGTIEYGPVSNYVKTNSVFVFAPQVDYEYVNKPELKLSASLSLGYAFNHHTSTEGLNLHQGISGFTGHLNIISFRWGIDHGICGHMGFGYKGFLGLGYFVHF